MNKRSQQKFDANAIPSIGDKFTGDNFNAEKFYTDSLSGKSFNFHLKQERLKDVQQISQNTQESYRSTSEKFIDVLLGNYETFMNIGKYVDRIDKNITTAMSVQKTYSTLLQNLRKEVEEFSFDYAKYLKEIDNEEQKRNTGTALAGESNSNSPNININFEDITSDGLDIKDKDFNLDEFLNPKRGSKRWIEEQPEKLRVMIDEKKYLECVKLVKEIRSCELDYISYDTKLELDKTYNYLIEKLTLSISRCNSGKDVKFYLEQMKSLGCVGLAIDTFLNWLSKKLKAKVSRLLQKDDAEFVKEISEMKLKHKIHSGTGAGTVATTVLNIIPEEEESYRESNLEAQRTYVEKEKTVMLDDKIITIIQEYFTTMDKFIKIMEEYFKIKENISYSTYIIPWLKQEIQVMAKQIESLFTKVTNITQLKSILRFLNSLFLNFDNKGSSAKYIFDLFFINNIKITLEAIITFCMKVDTSGVSFDLKEYEITHMDKVIKLHCASEIGNGLYNVSMIISDFIMEFICNKKKFIGIIFLEEYLFETILSKEFLNFMKNKITKNMSNNYDVKPFNDSQESMASSNQILINYGISILSIEKLFDFFYCEMSVNSLISPTSIESIKHIKFQINEIKNLYFSNLLKIKLQSHFFRFFENNKAILSTDLSEPFREPDRVFLVFFSLVKGLAKTVKTRVGGDSNQNNMSFVHYFILDNQYINFLKIIDSLKYLNEVYDTEFNFSKLGVHGLELIIHGVLFVYFSIQKIMQYDEDNKFKNLTDKFIEDFITEFGKVRNMSVERFLKNRQSYYENVMRYITENRIELLKGY